MTFRQAVDPPFLRSLLLSFLLMLILIAVAPLSAAGKASEGQALNFQASDDQMFLGNRTLAHATDTVYLSASRVHAHAVMDDVS